MGFRSYKVKLIIIAVLFMMVAQAIFLWIGYHDANEIGREIRSSTEDNLYHYAVAGITGYLDDANSLMTRLGSTDFTIYSQAYLNLQYPSEAAAKADDLNARLNALEISPSLVSKVFMLGDNLNQKSFAKSTDSREISSEAVPWIDDLRDSMLLNSFLQVYGMPVYYQKGQLTAKLDTLKKPLPNEQKTRLRHFLSQLEGHLVINNGIDNAKVMSFLVLGTQFLHDISAYSGDKSGYSLFLDQNDRVVWSNMQDEDMRRKVISLISSTGETACGAQVTNRIRLHVTACVLEPYGFKLLAIMDPNSIRDSTNQLLVKYVVLSIAAIVITFIIAFLFSSSIFKPFRALSKLIRAQSYANEIKIIPLTSINRKLTSISLRQKIAMLLLLSVILPAISAGFLYSWLLNTYSIDQAGKALLRTSSQMGMAVHLRMNAYQNLINKLSVDDRLQRYIFESVRLMDTYPVSSPDMFISLYPQLSEVSYFALYNSSGIARYSSIFLNNLDLFSQKIDHIVAQGDVKQKYIWMTGKRDVYNRPAISLIKKSLYPVYARNPGTQQLGYLELVLRENAFQSVDPNHKFEFVILDRQGSLAYQSNSNNEYLLTAMQMNEHLLENGHAAGVSMKKVSGQEQAVSSQPISGADWTMFVYSPLNGIFSATRQILYRDMFIVLLSIIIAYVIAWISSSFLERPVKRLQNMMEEIGHGNLEQHYEYEARDEIGSLVTSINKMIAQIHHLMDENVKNRVREQQLIALKTKAELSMLQQQINPHFLYNTLEVINMRSKRYGAMEICTMVSCLAKIFRFSISSGNETVSVDAEIEHIRNYITIQQIRFSNTFTVYWNIEPDVLHCKIMKFILQPIVENAINHGIMEYTSGGELHITAALRSGNLVLEVHDNGIGIEPNRLALLHQVLESNLEIEIGEVKAGRRGGGVGLKNVYNRLKIHYGDHASMTINSVMMQGTTVSIILEDIQT